ncbi:MAG: glycosyltransferase family 4 protein [Cyanobacteriota bacterium]|nr:glycosyltransferase family 4 protein [Cyanobacteriota bacterium]
MRITILQGAFLPVPPLRGGAMEKLWFELGKQIRHRGHSVCHVSRSFPGLPDEEEIEGVRNLRVRGYETPANSLHLKLLDLLYSRRALQILPPADILITNTFWMPILARRRQEKYGRIMVDVNRMPKGQMRLYSRSSCLRACSSAVLQSINREVPHRVNMIRMIPNPLPFLPPPLVSQIRQPVILFCGRLHPEKGIELLINAFANACEQGLSGWTLRLVGPADPAAGGGGEHWLKSLLIKPRTAGHSIEWLGPIYTEKELIGQYQQSAIFVYPSLAGQGEALPVAPLEAMACGAVPIVSDLACFRDYITPGVNGLVFNQCDTDPTARLAEKILILAGDPESRASLAEAALSVRQSHHPATIATEFLRCFEEMLQQPCA